MKLSIETVRKEVTVNASEEKAFRVFTEEFNSWWPGDHKIGKSAMSKAILEPKANGRWYEVGEDGSECDWGKGLIWRPYSTFTLAWQLNRLWQYDPSFMTEVEVTFTALGANRTRVSLEHRDIERFGAAATEIKNAFESDEGWTGLLRSFAVVAGT